MLLFQCGIAELEPGVLTSVQIRVGVQTLLLHRIRLLSVVRVVLVVVMLLLLLLWEGGALVQGGGGPVRLVWQRPPGSVLAGALRLPRQRGLPRLQAGGCRRTGSTVTSAVLRQLPSAGVAPLPTLYPHPSAHTPIGTLCTLVHRLASTEGGPVLCRPSRTADCTVMLEALGLTAFQCQS